MALDTRDNRASSINMGVVTVLPLANNSIDQGDRQHTANTYRGILAGIVIATVRRVNSIKINIGISV